MVEKDIALVLDVGAAAQKVPVEAQIPDPGEDVELRAAGVDEGEIALFLSQLNGTACALGNDHAGVLGDEGAVNIKENYGRHDLLL